jgi:hypothetical protein
MSESATRAVRWPHRLRHWTAWVSIWVIGIIGLIVVVNPSEPFKGCVHSNKNTTEYQELHERSTAPVATITRFYLRSRLIGICAANFADQNERTIGALAAVALAVFTLYLWRATHGLRRYAGIQARDMQRLLTAARDNTAAAAAQERAMSKQADAMRGLLEHTPQIERAYISGGGPREFITIPGAMGAHRPLPGRSVPTENFVLQINNHGKTAGKLLRYGIGFCDFSSIPVNPEYEMVEFLDWIGPATQSRPMILIPIPQKLDNPVIFGRFYYKDIFGKDHSSGFILRITQAGTEPILAPTAYTESD